ncbi:hypothetical protein Tco_0076749 [Tanacetum coccineum]
MIEGNSPKWLFDIDSLTQSTNYVPVAISTVTNESAGIQGELNAGTSTQKEEISQDCIHVEDSLDNEKDEKDKSEDDSSPKEVNTTGQHVITASPEVNTGASHILEATHVEFFSDGDEPKVDLGNILNSYTVPTTPNTRIHKDHSITNVLEDFLSQIQPTSIAKALSESS